MQAVQCTQSTSSNIVAYACKESERETERATRACTKEEHTEKTFDAREIKDTAVMACTTSLICKHDTGFHQAQRKDQGPLLWNMLITCSDSFLIA